MRITDMITQDEFINFSPQLLWEINRGNKWEFKCWSYGLKPGLIWLLIGQYLSLLLLFVHYLESLWKIFLFRWNLLNRSSQESKGGTVVRALTFHQCGLGSNLSINAICGSWLFVYRFSPLLREVFFPGTPVFPSRQKTTLSNSNLTRNHQVDEEPLSGSATSKFCYCLFIYLFTGC